MYLDILLCIALFITLVQSGNSTLKRDHDTNSTFSGAEFDLLTNKTKLPLVSEGGSLLPNTPDLPLTKQKFTSLISIDEEFAKTKEKSIVPRKGVDNLIADSSTGTDISAPPKSNNTVLLTPERLNTTTKKSFSTPESKDIHTTILLNKTLESKKHNSTEARKKPTILSYESLANMEKSIQSSSTLNSHQPKIPVAPSTKTMASSQIPSPNEDSIVKVYPSKASSHPGMIMPIVITILVVPMFAILGYMALRRGQEAWKNRHYKRMDFLLDGMYND